jgi:hypothetical protein
MQLTEEQTAAIPGWVDKWIKEGLRCDAADRPRSQKAITECYRLAKLDLPQRFTWVLSPLTGSLAFPLASYLVALREKLQTDDVVKNAVTEELGKRKKATTGKTHADALNITIETIIDALAGKAVNMALAEDNDAVSPEMRQAVSQAVIDVACLPPTAKPNETYTAVAAAILDSVLTDKAGVAALSSAFRDGIRRCWSSYLGGNFWVSWQAFESYFREVCGVEHDKVAEAIAYQEAQTSCCWWWPHKDFVVICDRPLAIHRDDRGRLHCTDGMALQFRDNWGLYMLGGVRVTQQIVEQPKTITLAQIRGEENQEVRRIMIERCAGGESPAEGWKRYMEESNARVIDKRRNDIDKVDEVLMATDTERVLICACPSTARIYSREVPPATQTCAEAQAYLSSGLSGQTIDAS